MSSELRDTLRFLQQENVRLQRENQQLQEEVVVLRDVLEALRSLQDVSNNINVDTDVFQLLDRILQAALICIHASDGSLLLVDEETNELAFVVVYGAVRDSLMGHRMPMGKGIAGWVAQNAQPTIVRNARHDPRFSEEVDQSFQFQTRSMLSVPIIYDNRVIGVIQALNKADGQEFKRGDLTLMGVVSQLAANALVKAESVSSSEEASK